MAGISFEVKDEMKTGDDLLRQNPEAIQSAMIAYQTAKKGPLCSGGIDSYAFMPLIKFTSEEGQVTVQKLLDTYLSENTHLKQHPIQEQRSEIIRSMLENPRVGLAAYFTFTAQSNTSNSLDLTFLSVDLQPGNFITLTAALLRPFSNGNVHIASSNPTQAPQIDPKYLSHPLDLEILARHLCYIETLVETEPLFSLLKPNGKRNAPKAYVKSVDAAKEYAQLASISNWHCVGTCAMLPREKGGVVDERLIAYGTKNLRVVDASLMPIISQADTQSTVYAVAERAADLIKAEHC